VEGGASGALMYHDPLETTHQCSFLRLVHSHEHSDVKIGLRGAESERSRRGKDGVRGWVRGSMRGRGAGGRGSERREREMRRKRERER
jgi:hypothetical protein